MTFSGALVCAISAFKEDTPLIKFVHLGWQTLTDLNDFITPSQACIKPVEQTNAPVKQVREVGLAEVSSLPHDFFFVPTECVGMSRRKSLLIQVGLIMRCRRVMPRSIIRRRPVIINCIRRRLA